jgi:sugar lactone lactonase YvrE
VDFSGDGGLATKTQLSCPYGVAIDAAGDIFISDTGNQRVRKVNGSNGIITTVAGNGTYGYSGNGGAATSAMIGNPEQLALYGSGNLYIAEQGACVIAKVNLSTGIISTVAGNGTFGSGGTVLGDGGLATQAQFSGPEGVVVDSSGDIFISDSNNQRVRMVSASSGIIVTVVGTTVGYSGDGGPSNRAQLHNPEGLSIDPSGNLYIADSYNGAIRKVTP